MGELILDSMPSVKESCSANGDSYSPWSFVEVEGIPDWTAVPMLAMSQLAKQQSPTPPSINLGPSLSIETVISSEQKEHLLALYVPPSVPPEQTAHHYRLSVSRHITLRGLRYHRILFVMTGSSISYVAPSLAGIWTPLHVQQSHQGYVD